MMIADYGNVKIYLKNGVVEVINNQYCWCKISESKWKCLVSRFGLYLKDSKYNCFQCDKLYPACKQMGDHQIKLGLEITESRKSLEQKENESRSQKIEIKKLEQLFEQQNEKILNLKNRLNILKQTKEELSQNNKQLGECYQIESSSLEKTKRMLEDLKKELGIEKKNAQNSCEDLNKRIESLMIDAQNLKNQHEISKDKIENKLHEKLEEEKELTKRAQEKLLVMNRVDDSTDESSFETDSSSEEK